MDALVNVFRRNRSIRNFGHWPALHSESVLLANVLNQGKTGPNSDQFGKAIPGEPELGSKIQTKLFRLQDCKKCIGLVEYVEPKSYLIFNV